MKFTRSHLLTIVYALLVLLYTLFVSQFRHHWWYYLEFLLIGEFGYFIVQGLLLQAKNWGIVLLLPAAVLAASVGAGYLLVFVLRLGGGTLLDADRPDMILLSLLAIGGSIFSLRWISGGKKKKKTKR